MDRAATLKRQRLAATWLGDPRARPAVVGRTSSMGTRQPTLKDMWLQAKAGPALAQAEKAKLGPRRAVIQCHHGQRRYVVGEVRGHAVLGTTWPHDLRYASYDIFVRCTRCPGPTGLRVLDLAKIKGALRREHKGVLKIDVNDVCTCVE